MHKFLKAYVKFCFVVRSHVIISWSSTTRSEFQAINVWHTVFRSKLKGGLLPASKSNTVTNTHTTPAICRSTICKLTNQLTQNNLIREYSITVQVMNQQLSKHTVTVCRTLHNTWKLKRTNANVYNVHLCIKPNINSQLEARKHYRLARCLWQVKLCAEQKRNIPTTSVTNSSKECSISCLWVWKYLET